MASAESSTSRSAWRNALGPTDSVIDVPNAVSLDTGDLKEPSPWIRPAPTELLGNERRKSIKFQKLDIHEANDDSGRSQIHLFGVTKDGYSILTRVVDFLHYFYYPAPEGFTEADLGPFLEYINYLLSTINYPAISEVRLEHQSTTADGNPILFLKIFLLDHRDMKRVKSVFTSGLCQYGELFISPELSYEAAVPYFLRFMLDTDIRPMTWLQVPREAYDNVTPERRVSCCQIEISVQLEALRICQAVDDREKFAPLRILSFDIESDVSLRGQMSDYRSEPVIQIGNVVSMINQDQPFNRTVFTIGSCLPINDAHVLSFEDESTMLKAWRKFFLEVDPDIVVGYNITQFDVPFLLNRAQTLGLNEFPFLGRIQGSPQILPKRKPTIHECPGYEGRLLLDVFPYILEHFPGRKGQGVYKLGVVAKEFIQDTKDDIHYTQIPIMHRGDSASRSRLASYCLKDAYLPLMLLKKLKCFEKEVKHARDACIPYNTLRVWRDLKSISKRYMDAITGEYVALDSS